MLRAPPPLRPGDCVAVVAPSGAFDRERFERGVALIKESRLVPVYDDAIFSRHRYLAGDDARRAGELVAALRNPEVRAIWTARGGYGATRILAAIEPALVAAADKWLVGFSDTTALHALWARAGLASLHAANVTTLSTWSKHARDELFALLTAPAQAFFRGQTLLAGPPVQGALVGGNLTVLAAMAGTGMLPSWRGAVVLLEDVGESLYRLDRCLTQLISARAFDGARGVVVGQLTRCDAPPASSFTALDVVADVLAPLGLPVLAGIDVGHEPSSRPVLFGARAHLDAQQGCLTVVPGMAGQSGQASV